MDTLSHAGWGYATLHAKPGLAWWGALMGALPDLIYFIPSKLEQFLEKGWAGLAIGREPGIWRADGPPLPPELVEAYYRYYVYSHSLVLLSLAAGALWALGQRRWIWLSLPYALHILMDIPTHERYRTQPFFPLSSWNVTGLTWGDPRIFWPNVAALVVTLVLLARKKRRMTRVVLAIASVAVMCALGIADEPVTYRLSFPEPEHR